MADPRVDAIIEALGGQAALDAWNANGNSLLVGYAGEQRKLGEHIATHPGPAKVAPHKHSLAIVVSETGGTI